MLLTEAEQREALEHRDTLINIRKLLVLAEGRAFIKYLFKNFSVGELPPQGLEENDLHDYLGYLRCGREIFKIVAEADHENAGLLIAEMEKEVNDDRYRTANENE